MKTAIRYGLVASAFAMITACGGGAGNVDPQGFWSGQTSTGVIVAAVVLDNGESWGVYTFGDEIVGALYGTASTDESTITIKAKDFDFTTSGVEPGSYTGTVIEKSSMALTSNVGITVSLEYDSSYDTPAAASSVTGSWLFGGRSGSYFLDPDTVSVDDTGRFTLSQTDCETSGQIVPRPGGKNVYDMNLISSGSGCAAGQSALKGIAILDASETPNIFLGLALNSDKSDGLIIAGIKQ